MQAATILSIWLIFTASMAIGKEQFEFCIDNDDCYRGECCLMGACTAFLSYGEKCNTLNQILSLQCPCEIGSSCLKSKCDNSIHYGMDDEIVEDRDQYHIENNSLDE